MKSKILLMMCVIFACVFTGCEKDGDDEIALEKIEISPNPVSLTEGNTQQLTATLKPTNATNVKLSWTSENTSVATVSESGLVTAVKAGSTTIKVKSGSIEASVAVTVSAQAIALESINVTPAEVEIKVGEKQKLEPTAVPENATDVVFAFASADETIATVSGTGEVTAVKEGETVITVSSGDIKKEIPVVVVTNNDPNDPEKANWKILGASTVWDAGYEAEKVLDNDNASYWHSDANGSMPQWLAIDMGAPKNIDGFLLTNRQDFNQLSRPKHIFFEISDDGENWTKVYENEELANKLEQRILRLEEQATARYFKVTINSTWAGAPYTYLAELGIYTGNDPAPNPGSDADVEPRNWEAEVSSILNENTPASNLIDGNIGSPWHAATNDPQPWVIVDFKKEKTIAGIDFTGRQGGESDTNASPNHIIVSVSNDKENWTTLLEVTNLPNIRTTQKLYADAAKTGRYLKIDIRSNWAGSPYSYLGELDIIEEAITPTIIPLSFTDVKADDEENRSLEDGIIHNMVKEQKDGYVILKTEQNSSLDFPNDLEDPYIRTTGIPENLGSPVNAFIRLKYKDVSIAPLSDPTATSDNIKKAQFIFFASGGLYMTGENLQYNYDAAAKAVADNDGWIVWQTPISVENGLKSGDVIRFDFQPYHETQISVKDLEIVIFK